MVEAENKPNYEYRVGLFAVIALIILFWGWSWLKDFSFNPPQRFQVQFHDIAGLTKNAPVQVNGVRVGVVEKIDLRGEGQVVCSLKIPKENTVIPQGSKITIQTLGLVGAKYIEITLPKLKPDEPMPPPIEPDSLVMGQDPVRSELYINHIAANLSEFTESLSGLKARMGVAKAAEESGVAIDNLKIAAAKFSNNMDRLTDVTADLKHGACSADGFFVEGKSTLQRISSMAQEWQNAGHKVNHIVSGPDFNGNIKETVRLAKETAEKVQQAMHELNQTLSDKDMRSDITTMLNKLLSATENISRSVQAAKDIAGDQQLRSDLKEAMSNAKDAMTRADKLLSNPDLINDAHNTMAQLRSASTQVREMAERINNLLSKKHPLLHMILGASLNKSVKEETKSSSHTQVKKSDGNTLQESTTESSTLKSGTETVQPDSVKSPSPDSEIVLPIQVHGEIR